jgi:hypothetical protein
MGRIYEKANAVVIWLGSSSSDIDLLMELIGLLSSKRVRRRKGYRETVRLGWANGWHLEVNWAAPKPNAV